MNNEQTTTAILMVDGFKGMAVHDLEETHYDIVKELYNESVWEVFDGVEQLARGKYKITLDFWWESCFPEDGESLVTQIVKKEKVK